MIVIDGAQGEGGGQVLRTALALSLRTGQPFRIENIRAKRAKAGLLRQHLTAVTAASEVGSASVEGAMLGSTALTFTPGRVRGGDYAFSIGTAGSTTLVLQTVLLPLLLCGEASTVTIEGGTHNPAAPPFEFLKLAFLPLLRRMGGHVDIELLRPGFFPRGGGRIRATIEPTSHLGRLDLTERGKLLVRHTEAIDAAKALSIVLQFEHLTEVFTAFGESPEAEAERYLASDAAVGEHLADQLLLPLALGEGGSFTTLPLSSHAVTNIEVIRRFLDVPIETRAAGDSRMRIAVKD